MSDMMPEIMLDDELEPKRGVGRGKLIVAGLCFFLSLLCGALWLMLLVAPNSLHSLF